MSNKQPIEEINVTKLMRDIKEMLSNGEINLKTDDYEISLIKNEYINNLEPLVKLLDTMVQDNYLATELYFENQQEFENHFKQSYDESLNQVFHSIRVEEIKFANEETYSGTLIYHEVYGGKLIFELSCIKFLTRFQKEKLWDIGI